MLKILFRVSLYKTKHSQFLPIKFTKKHNWKIFTHTVKKQTIRNPTNSFWTSVTALKSAWTCVLKTFSSKTNFLLLFFCVLNEKKHRLEFFSSTGFPLQFLSETNFLQGIKDSSFFWAKWNTFEKHWPNLLCKSGVGKPFLRKFTLKALLLPGAECTHTLHV